MRAIMLVAVGVLSVCAATAFAQQASAPADPLTGTWTGYMGRSDGERQPITVDLKFDGTTILGTITGPPYPGDITVVLRVNGGEFHNAKLTCQG